MPPCTWMPRLITSRQASLAYAFATDTAVRAPGALSAVSLDELASERAPEEKELVQLTSPDPYRFLQGELRALWQEGIGAMGTPGLKQGHRPVPVGPYRLAVIPSIRGRSGCQVRGGRVPIR